MEKVIIKTILQIALQASLVEEEENYSRQSYKMLLMLAVNLRTF